ncbi:hypothetical protein OC845_002394 [Tilletia horrida]|nr:hypothetical protein OC845_002394 [Tilletia horrida]
MAPSSPTKASQARAAANVGGSTGASRVRKDKEKDLSTATNATTTDESYFSISSTATATSASSSRAPSRAGNTTRETRSRSRAALQNNTNRPILSRTATASSTASKSSVSSTATANGTTTPSIGSMPTSTTVNAGLGLVGRVKAQAKALEAGPVPAGSKPNSPSLRSAEVGSTSPRKNSAGSTSPRKAETEPASSRPVAKKLAPSKLSCFEVEDAEGIKAYLRIRPAPLEGKEYAEPYIQVLNDTQVLMKPPREGSGSSIRARVHASSLPTKYTFTRVFAPFSFGPTASPSLGTVNLKAAAPAASGTSVNDQASFFQSTTLPLVRNLLSGESGLIFTYGVTNSGKSYTVLGGNRKNEAGILPRSLDVIFNSIKGRELTDARIRPKGLVGVEIIPESEVSDTLSPQDIEELSSTSSNNTTVRSAATKPFVLPNVSGLRGPALGRSASATTLGTNAKAGNEPVAVPLPIYDSETTTVSVDKNYRYSVWVSYVEVYNEKLFDLLDAAVGEAGSVPGGNSAGQQGRSSVIGLSASSGSGGGARSGGLAASFGITRSDSGRGSNWSIAGDRGSQGSLSSNDSAQQHITLNRRPLVLKNDPDPSAGGKYVAGLSEHRVASVQEAQALLQRGTENRVVFGTLANRMSSRSHGVFTIKVIREHAGAAAAALASGSDAGREFYTSRLSIVDLAGSERASNTGLVNGERLKEAGNINKSLMCLGQCMETIRKNQARTASMIPVPVSPAEAMSTAPSMNSLSPTKRRLSVVPFRHSKLTELFQSFFPGSEGAGLSSSGAGGHAVMIVNANPYDTGYDENSHVMKFSAVARDVQTSAARGAGLPVAVYSSGVSSSASVPAFRPVPVPPIRFAPGTPRGSNASPTKSGTNPSPSKDVRDPKAQQKRTGSSTDVTADARASSGPEVTIIEISDDEDNDSDAFVDMLMEKHEELRQRLYESELHANLVEERVRAEMAEQMQKRLQEMEKMYMERLLSDAADSEAYMNRKLDLLADELREAADAQKKGFAAERIRRAKPKDGDVPRTPVQRGSRTSREKVAASCRAQDESISSSAAEVEDSLVGSESEDGYDETQGDATGETVELSEDSEEEEEDSLETIASRADDDEDEDPEEVTQSNSLYLSQ